MTQLHDLARLDRLALHRAWYEDRQYDVAQAAEFYRLEDGADWPKLRLLTARIITNRHLGLEIVQPPEFKVRHAKTQTWLTGLLRLNGVRGAMRGAAIQKSWAGDVGVLFAYKPSQREVLGTPWQVGFIEPGLYEVTRLHPSGVFDEVDVYAVREEEPDPERPQDPRWLWSRTTYTREKIIEWPEVPGDPAVRPAAEDFETQSLLVNKVRRPEGTTNTLRVIPFVVVQNLSDGAGWEGVSDYHLLTHQFHRLNVHVDQLEEGVVLDNKLKLVMIDAEEVYAEHGAGITTLRVNSDQSGADDRQAQVQAPPVSGTASGRLDFLALLLDAVMQAAGVAQTGTAKELFGNEAASSSALQTFFSLQAAVAQTKRENWLGERPDYGLSGLIRKLLLAASRVDSKSPVYQVAVEDLFGDDYTLQLDWPPMFALSAPERQTLASVAQQANDDGLPPEDVAPLWARVLGVTDTAAMQRIAAALKKRQEQADAGGLLRPTGENAQRGILGSGQGDGLRADGGSATSTENPD